MYQAPSTSSYSGFTALVKFRNTNSAAQARLFPAKKENPTGSFPVRGFASCTGKELGGLFSLSAFGGDAKGRLRRWVGRTSVKGKGFAGDPRSVASGTLYRSLQPRIPSRDLSEEYCRLLQRFALLRSFGLSRFFRKGVDFSRFCAIIKVRGNTGDGCYLRLVKITASVWKLRAVISFCFVCRLPT